MILLLIIATFSILVSFLCSIWEAVLLSMPPSFVEIRIAEKHPSANILKDVTEKMGRPIAAILSLNTIAHTVGAMMVGAQAETIYGDEPLVIFGYSMPFSGEAVVATVMTLAILILSEIIPKTIGHTYWRKLTTFTAQSLRIVMIVMQPLIWLSEFITRKLESGDHQEAVSREDFSAMAEIGQRAGVFNPGESKIISNLMRFHLIQAKSIMTPRTVVRAAREDLTIQQYYDQTGTMPFSRIPVYKEAKDNITGFVLKDILLEHLVRGEGEKSLRDIRRTITVVKETDSIQEVFNHLLSEKEHIALVIDEFGGMAGIVTVEDVIETLLGLEIVDELDDTVDMQLLARQNWERRARRLGLIEEEIIRDEDD